MAAPGGLSVKGRALRYLAQREHSRAELERKLARHVQDAPGATAQEQIGRALDALAAAGLLSDRRAADALVSAQARRFGDLKLRHALRTRGLSDEHIAAALAPVQGSELERAREVFRRRYGSQAADHTDQGDRNDHADPAERARQARFLAGRGFSGETIRRVLRGLDDEP